MSHLHVIPDAPEPSPASTHRPVRLREIVGQAQLTKRLTTHLNAAVARGVQPGHVLLDGAAGLGKTTLGQAFAAELSDRGVQSTFRSITADAVPSVRKLVLELAQLEDGDVWFIDEIQELRRPVQVALYTAMEDGYMMVEARSAAQKLTLPRFTLIGATTHPGKLTAPLRDRFKLTAHVEPYAFEDLQLVVMAYSERAGIDMTFEAAEIVARASRYTPRRAIKLVEACRDYGFDVTGDVNTKLDSDTVLQGLEYAEVDRYGLDSRDRRVLRALATEFVGGPTGLAPLAASLGMDATELTRDVEPYLLQAGLLQLQPRGRAATRATYIALGLRVPALINGLLR